MPHRARTIILLFLVFNFVLTPIWSENIKGQQSDASIEQLLEAAKTASSIQISRLLTQLKKFSASDFKPTHHQQLEELIYAQPPQLEKWIMLAGFLEMQTTLNNLPDSLYDNRSARQAYNLALVRSGHPGKRANLMRNVRKIPVADDFIYQVAPLLIYTRQREAIDYLMDIILDSPVNCRPADAETAGQISCAYRLIEMLAPVLKDYPYTLAVSGDLETDDYPEALRNIQAWIVQNRDSYVILQERY